MRIAFAGTPAFASAALQALVEAGFDVTLVLTQPDRPAGRGLRASPGAVKSLALRLGLSIEQPASLRGDELILRLRASGAQALVVAAYGVILPPQVLEAFPAGCINIHASLLPRWRGAAPIQRAILAGDRETGISIMRMDSGLDTGPVYFAEPTAILADDTAASLHDRLASLGARCITQTLSGVVEGSLVAVPQPAAGVTYAHKITKAEAEIKWDCDAGEVDRRVRAFNPAPGAFSSLDGATVKIWGAAVCDHAEGKPGEILRLSEAGIQVACGHGGVNITELQKAGGKRLSAAEFVRGAYALHGKCFGS